MLVFQLMCLLVVIGWCGGARTPAGSCPHVCSCKWKGGKQTVECVDRVLITIPDKIDPATQVLDLSVNNLQILPNEIFEKNELTNLQRVYLRNCKLGQIDNQAFKGLTNLVELDLSNNLLTQIPTGAFIDVPFLRSLSLANNPIQRVHPDTLKTLNKIETLDLSNCELKEVSNEAFKATRLLETLKLNGNDLKELPPGVLMGLKKLRVVELYENPWTCDCRLRELKIWLTEHKVPSTIAASCASPPRLVGKLFTELNTDDFACQPEILPSGRRIEAAMGENATIVCRAEAVPPAKINWYWNGRPLINNSLFSSSQRLYIYEDGAFQKQSTLILTNVQEVDSSEFFCYAENKAGSAEENFTLRVFVRAVGLATLSGTQIATLSAALFIIILVIILLILVILVKLRNAPHCETKTPGRLDCVINVAKTSNGIDKNSNQQINDCNKNNVNDPKCNPVQKPPRVTDVPYSVSQFDGHGSVVTVMGPSLTSPTISIGNNPDLLNDMRQETSIRPGSGEYAREGSDSLYPSGLWEHNARDGLMPRASSTALPAYYTDKTPIMESCSVEGSQEELSYSSKTFPRSHAVHPGYPSDYGLPIMPSNSGVTNAKTLRVWQRAPPVLPPVTALKRALVTSRRSPDEGYQEGCGTDV